MAVEDTLASSYLISYAWLLTGAVSVLAIGPAFSAPPPLKVVYPPTSHTTTADQIFLIGSAPPQGRVLVNGQPISRNAAGYFAPSFTLKPGPNTFSVQYGQQEIKLEVNRTGREPQLLPGETFARGSLTPAESLTRLPGELLCFTAVAPVPATVSVKLANQLIPLAVQPGQVELPENAAVLTQDNRPIAVSGRYQGCTKPVLLGNLGQPEFQFTIDGQTTRQTVPGNIQILSPTQLEVAEVTVDSGAARTGPSTDYSRLTPLPKGTRATVTGSEGEWVRLDYGAWIRRSEVQIVAATVPPTSRIRSIRARQVEGWTEVIFPLQVPVPLAVQQGDRHFTLTLYNTTAQTDTIKLDDDPLIARLDWQQTQPGQVQYTFNLKTTQQWGYKLRYEGTSLILSLRHPPQSVARARKGGMGSNFLQGTTILLDPGHGGPEDLGATGPTGLPEKTVALKISQLLRDELQKRGARVVMTRDRDLDLSLRDRIDQINQIQPTLALSLHYNALPDNGNALKTQGVSTFWYNSQAHSLAIFLHNYLVKTLNRPSYGVFWNNLALTRPTVAPAVLLELGFMINPDEFVWIVNPQEQKRLAGAIADGVNAWIGQTH